MENTKENIIDSSTNLNTKVLICQICSSKILKKSTCIAVNKTFSLPYMKSKDEKGKDITNEKEEIKEYWLVHDMMTFENVGFTKTVDKIKYLICADCEIGPIGFQNILNPNELYVARDRVKYVE